MALFPTLIFAALGAALRRKPARLENFLASVPGPSPHPGEIRWLPRIFLLIGLAWAGIFVAQIFPYPHGQRPYFVPLLEVLLLLTSAAAVSGMVIWLAGGRRLLGSDETTRNG